MSKDKPITADNQHEPDQLRRVFLAGVMAEAKTQGYGVAEQGRLLVLALRVWEGR